MRQFSYVVARDFGFAPNPFFGWCTLATCKPRIRATAQIGDWVIGTGAKIRYRRQGHLLYAMQVAEVLTFEQYWEDPRFLCKRPVLNGSLKQIYGDNIYHRGPTGSWVQADSHHSLADGAPNPENVKWDTGVNRVLLAQTFAYFGDNAPLLPSLFQGVGEGAENICAGRGHRLIRSAQVAEDFVSWLRQEYTFGLLGRPIEFATQCRTTGKPPS